MNIHDHLTPELAEALATFQAEVPTVRKGNTAKVDTKNGGGYSYTYADLGDVMETAMPLLTQNGFSFSACPERHDDGAYSLTGVLLHTSGGYLTGSLPLHGRSPQEIGSSITYGRRYLLGAMTGIVTDDDDDAGATIGAGRARSTRADVQPSPLEIAQRRVQTAWHRRYGSWDLAAASQAYGGDLSTANEQELNAFADRLLQDAAAADGAGDGQ